MSHHNEEEYKLTNFLFGNVDKTGKLEADLDDETKQSIARLDDSVGERFFDLEGAGLRERSKAATSETDTYDADEIVADASAEDYTNINELAEDQGLTLEEQIYAQQAQRRIQEMQSQATAVAAAQQSSMALAPPQITQAAPSPVDEEEEESLKADVSESLQRVTIFTPSDGAIIKFSELFMPPCKPPALGEKKTKGKKHRPRLRLAHQSQQRLESDDEEVFTFGEEKALDDDSSDSDDGMAAAQQQTVQDQPSRWKFGQVLSVDDEATKKIRTALNNVEARKELVFNSVDQVVWESSILWDATEQTQQSGGKTKGLAHLKESQESSHAAPTVASLDTDPDSNEALSDVGSPLQESVAELTDSVARKLKVACSIHPIDRKEEKEGSNGDKWGELEPAESDDDSDVEMGASTEKKVSDASKSRLTKSVFGVSNSKLEGDDWLDMVVWDDRDVDKISKLSHPVIWDLNDTEMVFDNDEDEETTQKPLQKPKKSSGGSKESAAAAAALPAEQQAERVAQLERLGLAKRAAAVAATGLGGSENDHNNPNFLSNATPQSLLDANFDEQLEAETGDLFNLSNDQFYNVTQNRVKQKVGQSIVQHSVPALKLSVFRTYMTEWDLRNFRRPRKRFTTRKPMKFVAPKKKAANTAIHNAEFFKKKSDLSGRDGKMVCLEYMEEFPPVTPHVGMATRFCNYFRKENPNDKVDALPEHSEGEVVPMEPQDESPLYLGDVGKGQWLSVVESNLYKAPVFKHKPQHTDFLLVRSKDGKKFTIREMPSTYLVGQTQPNIEIPAPNSRVANNFIKNRLTSWIYRFFKKTEGLKTQDVVEAFPSLSETAVRKRLKECAEFQRGGDEYGEWNVKSNFKFPDEEELRAMVTPEMVCSFESMLAGHQRLIDFGLMRLTNPNTVSQIVSVISPDDPNRSLAQKIENELLLTPWNLTSSFLSTMHGRGQLQLYGLGDPSGRGDGFSFLRQAVKPQPTERRARKPAPGEKDKSSVTGTDADLRKLSLEDARKVLLDFGVTEIEIKDLTRWDRIALVRKMSNESAMQGGRNAGLSKFARASRVSQQQQLQQYRDQCQAIFEAQIKAFADDEPEISSDEEDLSDLDDFAGALEMDIAQAPTQRGGPLLVGGEDEEERQQLLELKEGLQNPSKKSSKEGKSDTAKSGLKLGALPAAVNRTRKLAAMAKAKKDDGDEGDWGAINANLDGTSNKKKRMQIKRTITTTNPDGTKSTRVEVIKDPKEVEAYLRKQRGKKIGAGAGGDRSSGIGSLDRMNSGIARKLTPQEEQRRKTKRRLQDRLRRLKRTDKKRRENKQALEARGESSNGRKSGKQCGACGLYGHMRTNRECPYYQEDDEFNSEMVSVEGTKVRIAAEALHQRKIPTIKIDKNVVPPPRGRRRRRGDEWSDDDEEWMLRAQKNRAKARRATIGPDVQLSNLFEATMNQVKLNACHGPFMKAVTAKEAPDYREFVKEPIDLGKILSNIKNFMYKSQQEFLAHMYLLRDNCYLYCKERHPHIPPQADTIVEIAEKFLESKKEEVEKLEAAVKEGGGRKPVIPASNKRRQPKKVAGTAPSVPAADGAGMASQIKVEGATGEELPGQAVLPTLADGSGQSVAVEPGAHAAVTHVAVGGAQVSNGDSAQPTIPIKVEEVDDTAAAVLPTATEDYPGASANAGAGGDGGGDAQPLDVEMKEEGDGDDGADRADEAATNLSAGGDEWEDIVGDGRLNTSRESERGALDESKESVEEDELQKEIDDLERELAEVGEGSSDDEDEEDTQTQGEELGDGEDDGGDDDEDGEKGDVVEVVEEGEEEDEEGEEGKGGGGDNDETLGSVDDDDDDDDIEGGGDDFEMVNADDAVAE